MHAALVSWACACEFGAAYFAAVWVSGVRGCELNDGLTLFVPDAEDAVLSAGDDRLAVVARGGTVHIVGRTAEVADIAAVGRIDIANLLVAATDDQVIRVADEANARHLLGKPLHGAGLVAGAAYSRP